MAIAYSYPVAVPELSDTLVGVRYEEELGNSVKNFNVGDLINLISQTQLPYKSYTAIISQGNTNAPVANVLENNLGGTLTWTYNSVGAYSVSSNGLFVNGKTTVTCSNMWGNWSMQPYPLFEESSFPNTIAILNIDSITQTQVNNIDSYFIEIRVYN